jgi:RimJ/RimL family protein N-acetyltransferase
VIPTIRVLTPEDAEIYFEHRRAALVDEPLAFAASPEDDVAFSVDAVRGLLARAPDSVVIGAFPDTLVGSIGIIRDRHLKYAHKMHIVGMYVSPRWRKRGIGNALLQAALDHARSLDGVSQIQLSVSDAVPAAWRLYERCGFRVWGTEIDSLRHDGRSCAEHHMVLELHDGAT